MFKKILQKSRQLKNSTIKKKSLDFISSHFYLIIQELDINYLEQQELEYVLNSSSLQIESKEKMQKLLDKINNYEISLHPRLWKSICRRLVSEGMNSKTDKNSRQINKNNKNDK